MPALQPPNEQTIIQRLTKLAPKYSAELDPNTKVHLFMEPYQRYIKTAILRIPAHQENPKRPNNMAAIIKLNYNGQDRAA